MKPLLFKLMADMGHVIKYSRIKQLGLCGLLEMDSAYIKLSKISPLLNNKYMYFYNIFVKY